MKKIIGGCMLAALFIGIFIGAASQLGVVKAALAFAATGAIVAWIVIAVDLWFD